MVWFGFFIDLGGWIWWFFVKGRKTDLDLEQSADKKPRNLAISILLTLIVAFFAIKLDI